MSKRSLLSALAAAGALALAGCGGGGDGLGSGGGQAGGNEIDRAFAAEMIPHHESAVEMAEIAQQRGESPFVAKLADDIIRTQKAEISTLRSEDAQLAEAGVKKGKLGMSMEMMGMGMDTAELKTATPFDDAFIRMMVPHHKGAIDMAEVELAKGSDPRLKALARAIIDAQQREIDEMTRQLAETAGSGDEQQGAAETDGARSARRKPARGTAVEAAAAGTGPRDVPVPASE